MATIARKNGGRVWFDSSVTVEKEDRRTARGIELRRQRKERKKMSDEFKKGRKHATAKILTNVNAIIRQRLVTLCGQHQSVDAIVRTIVDEFVLVQGLSTDASLQALHLLPNVSSDLVATNANVQQFLEMLGTLSVEFQDEFVDFLPASVVTSGSEEEDANQSRPRKRSKWRQMAANLAVEADGQGPPAAPAAAAVVQEEPPAKELSNTFH